jgi:hypothetical protein
MPDFPYLRDKADGNGMELIVVIDGEAREFPLGRKQLWLWFDRISTHLRRCPNNV